MTQNEIFDEYFEWMFDLVCDRRFGRKISYRRLLMLLHTIEFRFSIPLDENRAQDGIDLRSRFADIFDYEDAGDYLTGPCSVLEMMIALSIRCEEHIAADPEYGDRTGQWFWDMIISLGLGGMTDDLFDRDVVYEKVNTFLDRKYESDGKGGLFTVRDCKYDLRTVEIWYQMNWYLNKVL